MPIQAGGRARKSKVAKVQIQSICSSTTLIPVEVRVGPAKQSLNSRVLHFNKAAPRVRNSQSSEGPWFLHWDHANPRKGSRGHVIDHADPRRGWHSRRAGLVPLLWLSGLDLILGPHVSPTENKLPAGLANTLGSALEASVIPCREEVRPQICLAALAAFSRTRLRVARHDAQGDVKP